MNIKFELSSLSIIICSHVTLICFITALYALKVEPDFKRHRCRNWLTSARYVRLGGSTQSHTLSIGYSVTIVTQPSAAEWVTLGYFYSLPFVCVTVLLCVFSEETGLAAWDWCMCSTKRGPESTEDWIRDRMLCTLLDSASITLYSIQATNSLTVFVSWLRSQSSFLLLMWEQLKRMGVWDCKRKYYKGKSIWNKWKCAKQSLCNHEHLLMWPIFFRVCSKVCIVTWYRYHTSESVNAIDS